RAETRGRAVGLSADEVYRQLLRALAVSVFVVLMLIVYETARGAMPSIRAFGWRVLGSAAWEPGGGEVGGLPFLHGTPVPVALAPLVALPPCLGAAVYLAELAARRVGAVLTFVIELLASIPSIVFGVWGLFVLAPFLRTTIEPFLIAKLGFLPLFRGFPFGIG